MKIYLIVGSTGEYDDYREWWIVAYITKEQAEVHIQRINAIINEYDKNDYLERILENKIKESKLDPNCRIDWNRVNYNIEEIELFRHFDEFQDAN